MISITDIKDFFKDWFSQHADVCPNPADIDKHFINFNFEEVLAKEIGTLEGVIVALTSPGEEPLNGNVKLEGIGAREYLYVDLLVFEKTPEGDYETQTQIVDKCKRICGDLVQWMYSVYFSSSRCDYPIVELLDVESIGQSEVNLSGVNFNRGWMLRLTFKSWIDSSNITFNPSPSILQLVGFMDGTEPPASNIGADGYFYTETTEDYIKFYKKVSGVWTLLTTIFTGTGGVGDETDPIFNASAAYGISTGDIDNWNDAFAWGNHAGLYSLLGHGHSISDITGLSAALSGKANVSHTHATSEITGLDAALAGKANMSHTHTASNVTDFNSTARVATGISIYHQDGNTYSLTNTTADTILTSRLVNANDFQAGDKIDFSLYCEKTNGSTAIYRIYVNTTNSLTGATPIGIYNTSSGGAGVLFVPLIRSWLLKSTTSQMYLNTTLSITNDYANSTTGYGTSSINLAQPFYIIVSCQPATTNLICSLNFLSITINRQRTT